VQGELVRLCHPIAASTVWQILHDAGSIPRPAAPATNKVRAPRRHEPPEAQLTAAPELQTLNRPSPLNSGG
jgi:hypothetical protein